MSFGVSILHVIEETVLNVYVESVESWGQINVIFQQEWDILFILVTITFVSMKKYSMK
jgi:hypothetical protein